jgi:hypothetical protein
MRPLNKGTVSDGAFRQIIEVTYPEKVLINNETKQSEPFTLSFTTDGNVPFPQVIFRINGNEKIYNDSTIITKSTTEYAVTIPANELPSGTHHIQVEGCRKSDWQNSTGDDWIKWFGSIEAVMAEPKKAISKESVSTGKKKAQ